jgi:PST family polysaccharide transporter
MGGAAVESDSEPPSSFGQIIRSSSIMGSASVINILVGIARLKAAAVLVGPAGVGLIGLFQNLVASASAIASLGIGGSAARQIAHSVAAGDANKLAVTRRALLWFTAALMIIGGTVFWGLSSWIAELVLGDRSLSGAIRWLSLGIVLSVAMTSQTALLVGFRRIGDAARVTIVSGAASTLIGIGALLAFGNRALVAYVLLPPIAAVVVGYFYTRRLPRNPAAQFKLPELSSEWRILAALGTAYMTAGLAALLSQLAVRALIQRQLGPIALGHFQAGWAISMTYIGFVLQAMGTDYFPRISAAVSDPKTANRLVNEQTEVALLLAGPVLLVTLAGSPWILQLLYSSAFTEAAAMLRWQILGDLLKVASWPIGFLVLANGNTRSYMMGESLSVVFVLLSWVGLPLMGVEAAGVAFLGMYVVYLPVIYAIARRQTGFGWTRRVKLLFVLLAAACGSAFAAALVSAWAALAVGLALAAMVAALAWRRLRHALPLRISRS